MTGGKTCRERGRNDRENKMAPPEGMGRAKGSYAEAMTLEERRHERR
jgi:hypothetical protein